MSQKTPENSLKSDQIYSVVRYQFNTIVDCGQVDIIIMDIFKDRYYVIYSAFGKS